MNWLTRTCRCPTFASISAYAVALVESSSAQMRSNLDLHAAVFSTKYVSRLAATVRTVFLHHCPRDVSAREPRLHQLRLLWHHFQWVPNSSLTFCELQRCCAGRRCMDRSMCTPSAPAIRSYDLTAFQSHVRGRQRSANFCCARPGRPAH